MPMGTVNTSSAPFSSNSSIAKPISSGVASSILHLSSLMRGSSSPPSPRKARRQFAAPKSRVPRPTPMALTSISGMFPKLSAKCLSSAAPVGVHISPLSSPAYTGMPFSSAAVAGAGTGSMPWAHFTVPKPILTGEATTRSGAICSISSETPTTSAIASSEPTSWKCTRSGVVPCAAPSASAIAPYTAQASAFTRSETGRVFMSSTTSLRCGPWW